MYYGIVRGRGVEISFIFILKRLQNLISMDWFTLVSHRNKHSRKSRIGEFTAAPIYFWISVTCGKRQLGRHTFYVYI